MSSPEIKSILLVDDDSLGNLLNKIFIDKLNLEAEVDVVMNGQEALNFLIEKEENNKSLLLTPCLLLLDIRMPVMDGWQFLEQYDKLIPEHIKDQIVIVMLTVSEEQSDRIKAMNDPNIQEFIKKPLSENAFKKLISKNFFEEKAL